VSGVKKIEPKNIRSSAAEYLTHIAATGDDANSFEMRCQDENIWLTQKMMAAPYNVDIRTINEHIHRIYADLELKESSTIRFFRIVQTEGSRQVERDTKHYSLQTTISVGFKVNNERAVQFRKWAGQIVKDHTIQGWTMDVDRIKKGHMLTEDWAKRLDGFLEFNGNEILTGPRKISHEQAKLRAETEYEKYRVVQDRLFRSDFDKLLEKAARGEAGK